MDDFLRRIRPYCGWLGASALTLLVVSGIANATKAVTFAPSEPVVVLPFLGAVAIFKIVFGVGAAAIVIGVARLSALADALKSRKAVKAARAIVALGVVFSAVDGSLSAMALVDARAAVLEQHGKGAAVVELGQVIERLDKAAEDRAVLEHEDLASEIPATRRRAIRDAQRVLRIRPDGDYGPETQRRLNERLAELDVLTPADELRRSELERLIAEAERDTVPVLVLWAIAALIEVYIFAVLFGLLRAAPRAAKRSAGRAKGKGPEELDTPRQPIMETVSGHDRSTAKEPVGEYTRRRRGWAAIQHSAAPDGGRRRRRG